MRRPDALSDRIRQRSAVRSFRHDFVVIRSLVIIRLHSFINVQGRPGRSWPTGLAGLAGWGIAPQSKQKAVFALVSVYALLWDKRTRCHSFIHNHSFQ